MEKPADVGRFQAPFMKELQEIENKQREEMAKSKKTPSQTRRSGNSPSPLKKKPEGENMLREFEKWEFPENLTFTKLSNPSYAREQEQM